MLRYNTGDALMNPPRADQGNQARLINLFVIQSVSQDLSVMAWAKDGWMDAKHFRDESDSSQPDAHYRWIKQHTRGTNMMSRF